MELIKLLKIMKKHKICIIGDGKILADDTPEGLRSKSSSNKLDDVFREITHAKLS